MRIIERYVSKSVIQLFFTCLCVFMFLYVIIDVFSQMEDILKNQMSWHTLLRYYAAFLPMIFVQVAPFSCLLATLYTFGKLNRDNELIALRSAGLSIAQIIRPVVMFGVLIGLCVFFVQDRLVPASLTVTERIKMHLQTASKKQSEKPAEVLNNLSMYGSKNKLYFVSKYYPSTFTMENITILEHDTHQNIITKIVANKGIYKDGLWHFFQCATYNFDENQQIKGEPQFEEEEIMDITDTPADFMKQRQRPETMSISQLDDYVRKLSRSGATAAVRNFTVDIYNRLMVPLNSIILVLIGVPFSFVIRRRAAGLASVGIAIMVGFLYTVLTAISLAFGKAGIFPALLSAAFPHIIALSVSLYLIKSIR